MELLRTRYSRVKIEDGLSVESRGWSRATDLPKEVVKSLEALGAETNLEFNIFIFPLQKKFLCSKGAEFIISEHKFSQVEVGEEKYQKLASFLGTSSDLLGIRTKDKSNILVFFDDSGVASEKLVFPSRLEIHTEGKNTIVEVWKSNIISFGVSSILYSLELRISSDSAVDFIQTEDLGTFAVQRRKFVLGDGSQLTIGRIWLGNSRVFSFDDFYLAGERSRCSAYDVILARKEKFLEINSHIEHIGVGTFGHLFVRSVLGDSSHINYIGGAKIRNTAVDSDSFVELNAIKMSEKAKVYYLPQMEIDTNQVKAKHSSSISKVGEDEIFYLMSRGLDENKARKIIIEGFIEEILSSFPRFDFSKDRLFDRFDLHTCG